jgi:hypothetical protein
MTDEERLADLLKRRMDVYHPRRNHDPYYGDDDIDLLRSMLDAERAKSTEAEAKIARLTAPANADVNEIVRKLWMPDAVQDWQLETIAHAIIEAERRGRIAMREEALEAIHRHSRHADYSDDPVVEDEIVGFVDAVCATIHAIPADPPLTVQSE